MNKSGTIVLKEKPIFNTGTIPRPTKNSKTGNQHLGLSRRCVNPKPLTTPMSHCSKPNKIHNCLPPPRSTLEWKRSVKRLKIMKSTSLIELPVAGSNIKFSSCLIPVKSLKSKELGDNPKVGLVRPSTARTPSSCRSAFSASSCSPQFRTLLARRAVVRFVTNAWRSRKLEVDQLKAKNQILSREVDGLKLDLTLLRNDLKSKKLEENESFFNDSIELKTTVEEQKEKNKTLTERLNLLETEKDIWEAKEKKLKSKIKFLEEKCRETENVNFDLTQLCSENGKSLHEFEKTIRQLKSKLENTESTLRTKVVDLHHMQNKADCLQIDISELLESNKLLQEAKSKQKKFLIQKFREMKTGFDSLKGTIEDQNLKYDGLRLDFENVTNRVCELETDLEAAKRQLKEKEKTFEFLRLGVKTYEAERVERAARQRCLKVAACRVFTFALHQLPWF